MRAFIGPYPSHFVSSKFDRYMNKKYGLDAWDDLPLSFVDKIFFNFDLFVNMCYNYTLNKMRSDRVVDVKIEPHDTYSMDVTLSYIIHPMLIQLRDTVHGSPTVENKDVPLELRSTPAEIKKFNANGETDDKFHDRWHYVLDEMIWSFGELAYENKNIDSYDNKEYEARLKNGFRLFGKYYQGLWD